MTGTRRIIFVWVKIWRRNVRPFGIFVEMEGYRRHGLVHNSQVAEDMAFSREDEDEAKVKAMEFFAPVGSQVPFPHLLCQPCTLCHLERV